MRKKVHHLKIYPEYFEKVKSGKQRFEIRYNDRNFQEGDILNLKEYCPKKGYTGQSIQVSVDYVMEGSGAAKFGLKIGYVVMSISTL